MILSLITEDNRINHEDCFHLYILFCLNFEKESGIYQTTDLEKKNLSTWRPRLWFDESWLIQIIILM